MASLPRLHCPVPLHVGATLRLPAGATRHAQVLRLQPGDRVTLFGGLGAGLSRVPEQDDTGLDPGEFEATILEMGRQHVAVAIEGHLAVEREASRRLTLAIGMPANERMDWLVEKATELGLSALQPLMTERTVLRLVAERASKKTLHWRSIAIAACEQCGRNRVPAIADATTLGAWLATTRGDMTADRPARLLLSLRPGAEALQLHLGSGRVPADGAVVLLAGPEGGLSSTEEDLAIAQGFVPVHLGPRVLRAETAALAALTLLG